MSPTVESLVRQEYDNLSRTLRRTATWILANPAHVATRSLDELSEMSGQSSASFIRLAQHLGYAGWSGLREGFADMLRRGQNRGMFAERMAATTLVSPVPAMLRTEVMNVQSCYTPDNAKAIEEAVGRMAQARRIALVSRLSCTAVMTWLHYLLRMTAADVVLADDRGGGFALDLLDLGKKDVVIAASFEPCSRDTVSATRLAREAGAWTLGIVDAPLSALARATDRQQLVRKESDAFFDSMVGAMAAVQWLASAWVARRGEAAHARAKQHQKMMVATGAFEPDDLPSKPGMAAG